MLRSKVRTVGFGLLGAGRLDEGDRQQAAPASSTPVSRDEARLTATARGGRIAAGGWGRAGAEEDMDVEVEELMKSDGVASGKYHVARPGAAAASAPADGSGAEVERVDMTSEGYYELCVKSVEAVRWDPETDDLE
jgi:NADH dehydrogenase [ubiquinone] 1 alpha subcomplex assembly factor 1